MDSSRYKELEKEYIDIRHRLKKFYENKEMNINKLCMEVPKFVQDSIEKDIHRLKKIDKLLKRADEALCIYTRPIGNYKSSINNFD